VARFYAKKLFFFSTSDCSGAHPALYIPAVKLPERELKHLSPQLSRL